MLLYQDQEIFIFTYIKILMIYSKWSWIRQKWKQISDKTLDFVARGTNNQTALRRHHHVNWNLYYNRRTTFFYNLYYLLKPCSFQYFIFSGDGAFPALEDFEASKLPSLPLPSTDSHSIQRSKLNFTRAFLDSSTFYLMKSFHLEQDAHPKKALRPPYQLADLLITVPSHLTLLCQLAVPKTPRHPHLVLQQALPSPLQRHHWEEKGCSQNYALNIGH